VADSTILAAGQFVKYRKEEIMMNSSTAAEVTALPLLQRFRGWFATRLGVQPERKEAIYLELAQSASLSDPAYWLQILFAAGIATLGLVLNSPAVIIGAMLISPLMGPLLAAGLALAAGDLLLGVRAGVTLLLSCLVAIAFAILLVGLLPFREMTAEIAGRTHPNTLDLFVALFSGAIGSIAICREVKGVVTSIPGVSIAVALMPPLCVVGYGAGLALSQNFAEGMRVARGGGLLFLTNLVAITFMAMIVFLALHIDTEEVKERVKKWRREHPENKWARWFLMRFRLGDRARQIGSLRARFVLIGSLLALLLIPLSQSLSQLRDEYQQQRRNNTLRRVAADVWQQLLANLPNGAPRSFVDQLAVTEQNDRLQVSLRLLSNKTCTPSERAEYTRLLAARLGLNAETINLQLIEIPTAEGALLARPREEPKLTAPLSFSEVRLRFEQQMAAALQDLRLPAECQRVSTQVITSNGLEPMQIRLLYLSDHGITPDAQSLITAETRARCQDAETVVTLERIPLHSEPLLFSRRQTTLTKAHEAMVRAISQWLVAHPSLRAEILAQADPTEGEAIAEQRAQAVALVLTERSNIRSERLSINHSVGTDRTVRIRLGTSGKPD
jgi:uncharacterized hydrophobic protein (TIGR00271 family)